MNEIPKWDELLLPTLKIYGDSKVHPRNEVKTEAADSLGLPDELRNEVYLQTGFNKVENRIGFALSALKIAGLIEKVDIGKHQITNLGLELLKTNKSFNQRYLLDNYPLYFKHQEDKKAKKFEEQSIAGSDIVGDMTPEDLMSTALGEINGELSSQVLNQVRKMDPYKFEEVVSDLLTAMGYGKSQTTRKSGDGGIDAIVDEDKLGLSKIYAQAKRYTEGSNINKLAIRQFASDIHDRGGKKGIFITTSDFANDARELAERRQLTGETIILINGNRLADLMIEYNIGVSVLRKIEIKRVDSDYFTGGDE